MARITNCFSNNLSLSPATKKIFCFFSSNVFDRWHGLDSIFSLHFSKALDNSIKVPGSVPLVPYARVEKNILFLACPASVITNYTMTFDLEGN